MQLLVLSAIVVWLERQTHESDVVLGLEVVLRTQYQDLRPLLCLFGIQHDRRDVCTTTTTSSNSSVVAVAILATIIILTTVIATVTVVVVDDDAGFGEEVDDHLVFNNTGLA